MCWYTYNLTLLAAKLIRRLRVSLAGIRTYTINDEAHVKKNKSFFLTQSILY